jgi:enterochelin esterase family protein
VTPAIRELQQTRPLDPGAIDRFLATRSFPIVEGGSVTFVYRGPADGVQLQHWIFGLPSSQPFARLADTDLWYLAIELPPRSRLEYKFELTLAGERQLINDPLNPFLARDPYAQNSVCHGSGYEIPPWTLPDPDARPGTIEEIMVPSRALEGDRRVAVYLPARFRRTRRYPLLIVHDGFDYLGYAGMKTALDNLIHSLEVAPLIVALTQPGERLKEYADDPRHTRFLVDELLPALETAYPLASSPSARGLMGASFGAVASLAAAWRHPGHFGRLLLQSGSFAFTDIGRHKRGPHFDPVVDFVNAFRDNPGRPSERIFVCCGTYESLIYENRSMVPLLQATGMEIRYVEARDGHNWENWRDRLREGLSWLFPGPLWFVYE